MTNEALFWIIVYAIAGLLFVGAAAVIAPIGFRDLKDLLSRTEKTNKTAGRHYDS